MKYVAIERHGLTDNVGMELLAFGDDRRQGRRANRAAEITEHVEEAGSIAGILGSNAEHRDGGERSDDQRLADGADDIGQPELVAGIVERHVDVHETTDGKDGD